MIKYKHCRNCKFCQDFLRAGEKAYWLEGPPPEVDTCFCNIRTHNGKPEELPGGIDGIFLCDMFEEFIW